MALGFERFCVGSGFLRIFIGMRVEYAFGGGWVLEADDVCIFLSYPLPLYVLSAKRLQSVFDKQPPSLILWKRQKERALHAILQYAATFKGPRDRV